MYYKQCHASFSGYITLSFLCLKMYHQFFISKSSIDCKINHDLHCKKGSYSYTFYNISCYFNFITCWTLMSWGKHFIFFWINGEALQFECSIWWCNFYSLNLHVMFKRSQLVNRKKLGFTCPSVLQQFYSYKVFQLNSPIFNAKLKNIGWMK